jgi:hypothetical protein
MSLWDVVKGAVEIPVGVGEEAGKGVSEQVFGRETGVETDAEKASNKANNPRLEAERARLRKEQQKKTRKGNAYTVGASEYGGPGDPTSGHIGSSGHDLTGTQSFAELLMGHALGDLPYGTKLRITYRSSGETNPRTVVAEKLDIGAGGTPVTGKNVGDGKQATKTRRVDLWYETAKALGFHGLGLIQIERVDGRPIPGLGAAEEPYNVHTATYGTGNTTESQQPEPGKKVGGVSFLEELSLKKIVLLLVALGLGAFGLMWLARDLSPVPAVP